MNAAVQSLRWLGAIGIAAIAVLRVTSVFSGDPYFATDPLLDPSPISGFGPVGSLVLDVLLLLLSALTIAGEVRSERGVRPAWVLLALLPIVPVLIHGFTDDFAHLWKGMTWAAAAVAGVAAAHLARDRRLRAFLIASLAAVMVPLAVRGLVQVFVEHPAMVEFYEENRQQVLASQGIDPDSNAARIFEERLRQPEATGWFGLANVFGSFMVFGLVFWVGATIAAARAKAPSGWTGVTALVAIFSAAGLWFAGSKGAFGATLVGGVLLVVPLVLRPVRSIFARYGGAIAVVIIGLALLAIAVRGALMPENFANDRSVLFRWHYISTAAEIIVQNPVLGAGPDGFQEAYVLNRGPRSPEEVASAHSVFFDWLATLGLAGACWCSLLMWMIWRSGRQLKGDDDPIEKDRSSQRTAWALLAAAVFGLLPAFGSEVAALDPISIMARVLGATGFIGASIILFSVLERSGQRVIAASVTAAAIAVVVHAQIEVTMTHPSAVVWVFTMLGAAATCPDGGTKSWRAGSTFVWLVVTVAAVGGWILYPAWTARSGMGRAAEILREGGGSLSAEIEAREQVAALLIASYGRLTGPDPRPLEHAIEQHLSVAMIHEARNDRAKARDAVDTAILFIDRGLEAYRGPRFPALAAEAWALRSRILGEPDAMSRAVDARRRLVEFDPNGLRTVLAYADALWSAGARDAAAEQYRRALDISENWYLDPMRQLSEAENRRIRSRISEVEESDGG